MASPMRYQSASSDQVDAFIYSDHWHLQQKLDGVRVHAWIRPGEVTLSGAAGYPGDLTRIRKALLPLANHTQIITLDGELVEGKLWLFDLPEWGRKTPEGLTMAVVPESTWWMREQCLATMWRAAELDENVLGLAPVYRRHLEKIWLWEQVQERGLEGVVAKHRDGSYSYDERVDHVLKVKVTHTVDCVVLERNTGGKTNARLGLYRKDGSLGYVGNCSMIGKPDAQPGDVVEVKYLYAGSGGNLVQPTVLRQRDDKAATDCTSEQLAFISRDVLPYGWRKMPRGTLSAARDRINKTNELRAIAGRRSL